MVNLNFQLIHGDNWDFIVTGAQIPKNRKFWFECQ